MLRKFAAVALSVALLSPAWLSGTGLTLPVALVPLLWIESVQPATRRGWWGMLGWAALVFVLWNAATVWWIGYATPVGPVAATLVSASLNLFAFMLFHTVSKRAPRALASTVLVAAWITTEYWYTAGDFSWPWLVLGNGFSHDVWAVQWYEYTGVFGGSLWVLVCNLLLFEAWRSRSLRRRAVVAAAIVLPLAASLALWVREGRRAGLPGPMCTVSALQPNVDCYDKFSDDNAWQERNIADLLTGVPADAQFVLLPETSLPGFYREPVPEGAFIDELRDTLRSRCPGALLVAGANTLRIYPDASASETARPLRGGLYCDIFNAALGIDTTARVQIHRKCRLVIGVENTPTWIFRALRFLVVDLGGVLGQIGRGEGAVTFTHAGVAMAPAICYEGLYGDFMGSFVRGGAELLAIVSNDGWWRDTPGYRHLFSISRLRAVEHRRAVVRSANTGRSGFISPRGDVGATLGWQERGVITARVPLSSRMTFYTRHGDYVGRAARFVLLLSLLYFVAYRVRRRNHLVP